MPAYRDRGRNDKSVRSGEQPPLYEDRFSIMLDDGEVPLFAQQGCWLTCHNGMRDTKNQKVGEDVKKHPLFSDARYDADISCRSSGSRRPERAVEPTRSQNITVSCRRSA